MNSKTTSRYVAITELILNNSATFLFHFIAEWKEAPKLITFNKQSVAISCYLRYVICTCLYIVYVVRACVCVCVSTLILIQEIHDPTARIHYCALSYSLFLSVAGVTWLVAGQTDVKHVVCHCESFLLQRLMSVWLL
jgi:hypothetical protein